MAQVTKLIILTTDKALKDIELLTSKGHTEQSLAAHFGMTRTTFRKHKTASPEIQEAIARGNAKAATTLVGALYKKAKGYNKLEVQKKFIYDDDGSKVYTGGVEINKHYPPSEKAIMQYLTNKDPENWSNKEKATVEVILQSTDGKLTPKQLADKLKKRRAERKEKSNAK